MGLTAKIDEQWSDEIRLVNTRHEEWAVSMADGYARTSDNIGVCAIGRGPAVAHTGTALATAAKKGSPLLLIVPEPRQDGSHDDKEFAQEAYMESVLEHVFSVRSIEALVPTFSDVFHQLRNEKGPVAVQIPMDLLNSEITLSEEWRDTNIGADTQHEMDTVLQPDQSQVELALAAYLESDGTIPPVILVGAGAVRSGAREDIHRLAEKMSAIIVTTLQARGYFSSHPFAAGFVGDYGAPVANEFLSQSDFVLAVGCSLNRHTTDKGRLVANASTVVHVDREPAHIDRHIQVDLGIVGDAATTVKKLEELMDEESIDFSGRFWTDRTERRIAGSQPWGDTEFATSEGAIDPRELVTVLDSALPQDRIVTTDGGHFTGWILDGISITHPEDFIWTLDFLSMGVGTPIGLGSSLAVDTRVPIIFCGDGGFLMSVQATETAVREDIPAIIIILNDGTVGAEYHFLERTREYSSVARIPTPNLATVAESMGAEAYSIRSIGDIEEISHRIGESPSQPLVLDCHTDHTIRHRIIDSVPVE